MGSSGTPRIVARILESFEGKPYRVIAPVKFQLQQVPGARVPSNVVVTDWVPALQVNKVIAQWDGPKLAADMLFEHYGDRPSPAVPAQ